MHAKNWRAKMSIKYFNNNNLEDNNWEDITREERFFCSELFSFIKNNEKDFVKFLNKECNSDFDEMCNWDSGYEVCFYRDFLKSKKRGIKKTEFPQKRTFDLCLFSNECIIIIEAKVQQPFRSRQNKEIEKDKERINDLLKDCGFNKIKVKLISLASSIYYDRCRDKTLEMFDYRISWNKIAKEYKNKYKGKEKNLFEIANEIYGKR